MGCICQNRFDGEIGKEFFTYCIRKLALDSLDCDPIFLVDDVVRIRTTSEGFWDLEEDSGVIMDEIVGFLYGSYVVCTS